jgi:NitT/TauT family transport system permease protein
MKLTKEKLTDWFYGVGSIALFIIIWQLGCSLNILPVTFVASPVTIVETLWQYFNDGSLYKHTTVSLKRAFYGFMLATAVAVPLGFMLGGWLKL